MRERRIAVILAHRLRFLPDIEHIARLKLHAERRLHRLNPAFQKLILPERLLMLLIERLNQIELLALRILIELLVLQIPDHLLRLNHRIVEVRALMLRRQEPRARQTAHALVPRIHHDKPRQVLVLAAQPVRNPRAHRWPRRRNVAGVEQTAPRRMRRIERIHRLDHAHIVDHRRNIRQQARYIHAAAPVLLELKRRRQQPARSPLRAQVDRRRPLPLILHQRRLRVEHIQLRRPAAHEQHDIVLGFRREVRKLRRSDGLRGRGARLLVRKHSKQSQGA